MGPCGTRMMREGAAVQRGEQDSMATGPALPLSPWLCAVGPVALSTYPLSAPVLSGQCQQIDSKFVFSLLVSPGHSWSVMVRVLEPSLCLLLKTDWLPDHSQFSASFECPLTWGPDVGE